MKNNKHKWNTVKSAELTNSPRKIAGMSRNKPHHSASKWEKGRGSLADMLKLRNYLRYTPESYTLEELTHAAQLLPDLKSLLGYLLEPSSGTVADFIKADMKLRDAMADFKQQSALQLAAYARHDVMATERMYDW